MFLVSILWNIIPPLKVRSWRRCVSCRDVHMLAACVARQSFSFLWMCHGQDSHAATLVVGAIGQEAFRGMYLLLYRKAEVALREMAPSNEPVPLNDLSSAIAAGLGYGVMSSVVMYGSLLATSVGSAVLYSDQCSEMSLFLMSGVCCALIVCVSTACS